MTSKGSVSRIRWEGDSNKIIRSWPEEVRQNIGLELHRLDNREEPLNSRPMSRTIPGASELRDDDRNFWYRLIYWVNGGWIYVLHCFKKKTNQTPMGDIEAAKTRLAKIKARKDAPGKEMKSA